MAEPAPKRRPAEGITVRHARGCGASDAGRCRCQAAYQAQVFSPPDRRTIRKSFKTLVGEASLEAPSDDRVLRPPWQAERRHEETVYDVCSRAVELSTPDGRREGRGDPYPVRRPRRVRVGLRP